MYSYQPDGFKFVTKIKVTYIRPDFGNKTKPFYTFFAPTAMKKKLKILTREFKRTPENLKVPLKMCQKYHTERSCVYVCVSKL